MTSGHSHVTRNGISSDLTRSDISEKGEQVRDLILIRLDLGLRVILYKYILLDLVRVICEKYRFRGQSNVPRR